MMMENVPPSMVVSEYKSHIIPAPSTNSHAGYNSLGQKTILMVYFPDSNKVSDKESQRASRLLTRESDCAQWLRILWILLTHQAEEWR